MTLRANRLLSSLTWKVDISELNILLHLYFIWIEACLGKPHFDLNYSKLRIKKYLSYEGIFLWQFLHHWILISNTDRLFLNSSNHFYCCTSVINVLMMIIEQAKVIVMTPPEQSEFRHYSFVTIVPVWSPAKL